MKYQLPKLPTLAARLKWAREERGMTQTALGEAVGKDQTAISKIERGDILNPREIVAIGEVLGVSPAWLQYGVERLERLEQATIDAALALQSLDGPDRDIVTALIQKLSQK